jgi:integral membrane protein (TIGR01906 family)
MKDKKVVIAFMAVMILAFPIMVYLFSFNLVAFNDSFYKKEFLKYDLYSELDGYDIESVNSEVISYLKDSGSSRTISNDFFNEREKVHLLDVKNIIHGLFLVYLISTGLFLAAFAALIFFMDFYFKNIMKIFLIAVFLGSILALLCTLALFTTANMNFDFLFGFMHKTFFSFGTYSFNPEYEKIVVIYPENLFFDAFTRIIFNVIISSVTVIFFCIAVFYLEKKGIFQKFLKKISSKKAVNRKF